MCEERRKSINGHDSRLATTTGGLSTEIGRSEVDAMVGQSTSTDRVDMPLFSGTSLDFEMPPREKLIVRWKLPQRG